MPPIIYVACFLRKKRWKIERCRTRTGTWNDRNRNLLPQHIGSREVIYMTNIRVVSSEDEMKDQGSRTLTGRRFIEAYIIYYFQKIRVNTSRKSSLIHYPMQLESRHTLVNRSSITFLHLFRFCTRFLRSCNLEQLSVVVINHCLVWSRL